MCYAIFLSLEEMNFFSNSMFYVSDRDGAHGRLRISKFINQQYVHYTGVLNELEVHNLDNTPPKAEKNKVKHDVEQWKSKKKRKMKYVATPKKLPKVGESELEDSPMWAGKCALNGKQYSLTNTCPIDNLIFLLISYFKDAQLNKPYQDYQIIKLLGQMSKLAKSGQWTAAKVTWLIDTKQFKPTEHVIQKKWDIYNSEDNAVVDHLKELLCHVRTFTCDNEKCPQKQSVKEYSTIELR